MSTVQEIEEAIRQLPPQDRAALCARLTEAELDPEMLANIQDRVSERRISFLQAYEEEAAARAELAKITPSYEELESLANRFPPPQEWYDD